MASALSKPESILTHESDLDGLLSGLLMAKLAEKLFGEAPKVMAYQNLNWQRRVMKEDCAWVTDFSFDKRVDKDSWLILDHHHYSHQPTVATLVHDSSKSASLLAYDLCREHGIQSEKLDRLVHLSNVSDLFLEEDPEFELASDYANLVKAYGFWSIKALCENDLESLLDHPLLKVMTMRREIEDPIGLAWTRDHIEDICPGVGLAHTTVGNTNLIAHKLLTEENFAYNTLLILNRKFNGMISVSLRSRNEEALSHAEKLQGGGHPNACGATLPKSIQSIPDAVAFLKKTLHPISAVAHESLDDALDAAF